MRDVQRRALRQPVQVVAQALRCAGRIFAALMIQLPPRSQAEEEKAQGLPETEDVAVNYLAWTTGIG